MPIGKVKWFDCKKGFGFITGPATQDIFVHFTVIEENGFRRLRDGEAVEYEVTTGPKGYTASWVKRLPPHNPPEAGLYTPKLDQESQDDTVGNR